MCLHLCSSNQRFSPPEAKTHSVTHTTSSRQSHFLASEDSRSSFCSSSSTYFCSTLSMSSKSDRILEEELSKRRSLRSAKSHIEEIRRKKFSIGAGAEPNPLTEDLHHSVHNLSKEIYTKDIHFLMELIQNAEDNEYPEVAEPTVEFVITSKDITGTGAPMTLLVFNNEIGFSKRNIESLCSVGRSTKRGRRHEGFVGEKGIGFKSVFLVTKHPYIFSNGYQVRFSDEPNHECGVGYIVPEWVETPSTSDINEVHGYEKKLPVTTIILPLKSEKVKAVKKQLSEVHPETLLFLSKISHLSVREHKDNSSCSENILSSISISSRNEHVSIGSGNATSSFVQLSAREETNMKCWYYMWRQAYPVKPENKVGGRQEVNELAISLAFPFDERLTRGATPAGIFAFLPTEMVTGFPFIIQADFVLASSREVILMDNKWNLGILDCVSSMFVDAIVSYMNSSKEPMPNLVKLLKFLPLRPSSFPVLNNVRDSIRAILKEKPILPYETFSDKKLGFCKPVEAIRILTEFRALLMRAKKEGLSLNDHFSTGGRYILHSSLDGIEHLEILAFLGVESLIDGSWYRECIKKCKLMEKVSQDVYIDLLSFVMDNMQRFRCPRWKPFNVLLIKFVKRIQNVTGATTVDPVVVYYGENFSMHAWLNRFNEQFAHQNALVFMSDSMYQALARHKRGPELVSWLGKGKCLVFTSVPHYIISIMDTKLTSEMVIMLTHFLFHSFEDKLVHKDDVYSLCSSTLPVVDGESTLHKSRKHVLVPASGSKWMKLFGVNNPFREQKYVELGGIYAENREVLGKLAPDREVLSFLIKYTGALDLPELCPPDVELPISDVQLTSDQAFLLLDWIQKLKSKNKDSMPERFTRSIQSGNWMKTNAGFKSPNQSFLLDGDLEPFLIEIAKVIASFPIIDEQYYKGCIAQYIDVLKSIGVKFVSKYSYAVLEEHIIRLVSSPMTKDSTFSLLKYIKHAAKKKGHLSRDLWNILKRKEWLMTTQGLKCPFGSVFMSSKMEAIAQISKLSVIDEAFYGDEINNHVTELGLLGVVVDVEGIYNCILSNFTFPTDLAEIKKDSVLLLLRCIREKGAEYLQLIEEIRNKPWVRTSMGLSYPSVSIIFDALWDPLSGVAKVPVIDEAFYGNGIRSFIGELKKIGVAVDSDGVQNAIAAQWKLVMSSVGPTCEDVLSLLNCVKYLREKMMSSILHALKDSLLNVSFLKTRIGYRSPPSSVLFDCKWGMISQFVDLPLIDDGFYGLQIYGYRGELEEMGVVVNIGEGSNFVVNGLMLPKEPGNVAAETCLVLLGSIRSFLNNSSDHSLPHHFLDNLRESKWLKTHTSYRTPNGCLLFDSTWASVLKMTDGPFLDQEFYGPSIHCCRNELKAIGVKVEPEQVSMAVYENLRSQKNFQIITRIYGFLDKVKWKPSSSADQSDCQVWIPDAEDTGNWVKAQNCVLNDRGGLFRSSSNHQQIYVLIRYYDKSLLQFFSSAFKVRESPSIIDYVALWKSWELKEHHELTHDECQSFCECIVSNWKSSADIVKEKILKLPAITGYPPESKIYLKMKNEVCIPDDPDLESMFTEASKEEPLFVWFPKKSEPSIPFQLLRRIYSSIGVRNLSELVKQADASSLSKKNLDACLISVGSKFESNYLKSVLITEGLIRIVLGFLAGPQANMPMEKRHEIVKSLSQLAIYETDEPIRLPYILEFPSSDKTFVAKTERLVFWEKISCSLFLYKSSFKEHGSSVQFISFFAREICRFVSQDTTLKTNDLWKLIQMSFRGGFEIEDVRFLMKEENLQVLEEDEELISFVFSSGHNTTLKRKALFSLQSSHQSLLLEGGESTLNEERTEKGKRVKE